MEKHKIQVFFKKQLVYEQKDSLQSKQLSGVMH